ncbi:MAG: hypothetical protein IPG12_10100 [Saprospiraceae bacterium]|nr:hypothetical protein [Saprospiraceae bacterium]
MKLIYNKPLRVVKRYYLYFLPISIVFSCSLEDTPYNPCSKVYNTETLQVASRSRDWVNFTKLQELKYINQFNDTMMLTVTHLFEPVDGNSLQFKILCPEDSLQMSVVNYSTRVLFSKLTNSTKFSKLLAIEFSLDVVVDETKSNLDDIQMADVLQIYIQLKNPPLDPKRILVLQIPILDRGFQDALLGTYAFFNTIKLGKYQFANVYSNYENEDQLKVYYSNQGLIAFDIENNLFVFEP